MLFFCQWQSSNYIKGVNKSSHFSCMKLHVSMKQEGNVKSCNINFPPLEWQVSYFQLSVVTPFFLGCVSMPIINLPLHKLCASSVTAFIETPFPTLSRHFPGCTAWNATLAHLCEKMFSFSNRKIVHALSTLEIHAIYCNLSIQQFTLYRSLGILK